MTIEENMYRNFGLDYPRLASNAISYEPFDEFQIIINLKNGERILYDDLDSSIEYIEKETSEDIWKRRFAKVMNRRIRLSGMDRDKLSEKTGISKCMISRYSNGKSMPSIYTVSKIADVLGCSINDFLRFPK